MNLLQIYEPGQTPLPHQDAVAMGIDLGTTHSVVAISSGDGTEVVQNIHGHSLVPSVVYYGENNMEVGYPAKKRHEQGEAGAIASIKRKMHDGAQQIAVGNRKVTPVEISAEVLKHLKQMAEQALGREVNQAVITVPAYFDDAARIATKDAGKLAGLEVLRLLNEPTAAALAYGLDKGVEGIYAVYDLGGGTFDISLLKLEQGVFQVLATGGDTQLGGDDIDALIPAKPGIPSRLIKEKLSEQNEFEGFTRAELEKLARPLIQRTIDICMQAFADAGCDRKDVKGVVLVGGSTRMPLVRQMVGEWFGREPLTDVNPDEVVAIGAAIQARGLTQGADHLLLDVIPLSLGLETSGGLTEKIVERNTPIPVSVAQEFTTGRDGQTAMSIHVVQGERELVAHNRSLAKFELVGIPPLPVGIARIRITFTIDADGLLTVTAEEKTTGVRQSVEVQPSYGIAPADMERMLRESMENARQDMTDRLLVEARMDAERTIVELESAIKQDGALLQDAERKLIDRQVERVRQASDGGDYDLIDAELSELARLVGPFAQRRMDKAIASALKGTHIDRVEKENHA